ncbi:hypothetical protein EYZ11_000229 [Aspergillus tanneri]|uniref:Uncharacterized protein n=1 Tax=Aspergillus tanneri TaxID=1220188 RepID=A0A4S3JXU8_9EURO|nr:uncharacterized protein ATNIH1004_006441 [Aspergillus tanneri]KAA8647744.1 hypothetical protein ATNIH1004_006441 [Aspergillus tanneri]THD00336.1 hypothetical protein EYZ11_000229 [Aspergillus tanneri]
MAFKNGLIKFLCISMIASSAVAAPAPELAQTDVASGKLEFHEYLNNIDKESVKKAIEMIGQYRHDHDSSPTSPAVVKLGKRDNSSSAVKPTHVTPPETSSSHSDTAPTTAPTTASTPSTTDQPPSSSSSSSTSSDSKSQTREEPTSTKSSATHTTESTSSSTTNSEPTSNTPTSTSSSKSNGRTTMETTSSTKDLQTTSEPTHPTTPYTSTYKSTTTLANGERSTVTSVTVVHPTQTNRAGAGGTGTGPAPGLQTDSAASNNGLTHEFLVMMGGAAMVAMAL